MKVISSIALTICLIFTTFSVQAQLIVNQAPPYNSPAFLVQNVLLGSGITATNITYSGSASSIAYFDGSNTNLNIPSGVLLSSGAAIDAIGPNNQGGSGQDLGQPGDPLLTNISGNQTFDAAILEFDFVVSSDTLRFNFVFGSEEYPEFVNASYNDAFGFFISGPNPAGGNYVNENVALVPGTTTIISIDNVNVGSNSAYYIDNSNGASVQYDAFTTLIPAEALVVCGQQYHIKMTIADGGDGSWDSGVFLEEGTFTSAGGLAVSTQSSLNFGNLDTAIVEGCSEVTLDLQRSGAVDDSLLVRLFYGGVAINGTDYDLLPDSLYMRPNQVDTQLLIHPIVDGLVEPNESFEIYVELPANACLQTAEDTFRFTIIDEPELIQYQNFRGDSLIHCLSDSVRLEVSHSGGLGFYETSWSTNDTGKFIWVSTDVDTLISASVTDTCGRQLVTDTFIIRVPNYDTLLLNLNTDTVCKGKELLVPAYVTGGDRSYNVNWSNGSQGIYNLVQPNASFWLTADVIDGCGQVAKDSAFIFVPAIAIPSFEYITAPGEDVVFTNTSTNAVQYHWSFGDGFGSYEENPVYNYLSQGVFEVVLTAITDGGCDFRTSQTVLVYPDFTCYMPNAFRPLEKGKNRTIGPEGILIKYYTMHIYDRWGDLLFATEKSLERWDGTFQGRVVPEGVYGYILKAVGTEGEVHRESGYIMLLH